MLIKWVKCQVDFDKQALFSEAQKEWKALRNVDGFIGQVGGWDEKNPVEAGILAFWENEDSYQRFMKYIHDGIFYKSNQRSTYRKISVRVYEKLSDMGIGRDSLMKSLSEGTLLRISEIERRQSYFEQIQNEVWNKGMGNSPGMLSGVFCKRDHQYLVASFWQNSSLHQRYVDIKLPSLLNILGVKDFFESISGNFIKLEKSWTVI
ncbi:heme-degrading monooxygenase HmoA [Bacillus pakistanensis]|uniref:Heme-degrading monooxygenase HmoA n=1 Tax=Rossellomorea pakistanensis TaxID=992288 RepID=A0ABS2NJU7_9BACI|nr:YdbC family protein [Bacillus pakistanensis]MBM7588126.1 heme-degrading monooxygenase HmoA [Bacillus pakistanensis]